mmetsp:Transcript_41/g.21  ORF Transcript_41/g.21 Transcript_41/m.21 type:complete len:91 (-) Transcript_41:205-477(-)
MTVAASKIFASMTLESFWSLSSMRALKAAGSKPFLGGVALAELGTSRGGGGAERRRGDREPKKSSLERIRAGTVADLSQNGYGPPRYVTA